MVTLTQLCNVDLVVHTVAEHGASIGLKLLRTGALIHSSFSAEHLCNVAQAAARPTEESSQTGVAKESSSAEMKLLAMQQDCADEVLARLLPHTCASSLLPVAASRNFLTTSALLIERGGSLQHVEVRRGCRRGLVDIAARAACLDGDWRLVIWLLGSGATTQAPKGLLYLALKQGRVALARDLVRLGVRPGTKELAGLLFDVCTHGATEAVAFLIEELGVSGNVRSTHNEESCTDRALAYRCWETAEWLVAEKGVLPAKLDAAVSHLFDAAGDPRAARVFRAMHAVGCIGMMDLLEASSQRGDIRLCRGLLSAVPGSKEQAVTARSVTQADMQSLASTALLEMPRQATPLATCILPKAVSAAPGISPRQQAHRQQQQHQVQIQGQQQRQTPRHQQQRNWKNDGRRSGIVTEMRPQRVGSSVTHPRQLPKRCNKANTRCQPLATNRGGLARKSAVEALGLLLPESAGQEVEQTVHRAGYGRPGWLTCR